MRKPLRAAALLLALLLFVPTRAVATTIDEVKQRQEEIKQENDSLQAKIDALKEDEDAALAYQAELEEKITETEGKIDQARETIQTMNETIKELEKKLELTQKEYQQTIDTFYERLRALYLSGAGSISTLEILMSSTSFADFAVKAELVSGVARHDQELLDKITEFLEKTQADRDELTAARQQVAAAKKELEAAQEKLDGLYEENQLVVEALEAQQADAQQKMAQNAEEDAQLQAQLQKLIEQRNEEERRRKEQAAQGIIVNPANPGMQSGFSPIWPLPGVGVGSITGHFGDYYPGSGHHNGLDIGAGYGTPIVATQAGQVLSAEFHYSWGNNVLIWHNDTFSTRYAHCSSLAVSAGQYVEQGQIIGYVGSTGYSFGNHLHYEVYCGGVRVNPDPYLGI